MQGTEPGRAVTKEIDSFDAMPQGSAIQEAGGISLAFNVVLLVTLNS